MSLDTAGQVTKFYYEYPKDIFGLAYHALEVGLSPGILGQGENLFVHACITETNQLGHKTGNPQFNAHEFAFWIQEFVLPWNYHGNVYLATDRPASVYGQYLLQHLDKCYEERLFRLGSQTDHQIPKPTSRQWVKIVNNSF